MRAVYAALAVAACSSGAASTTFGTSPIAAVTSDSSASHIDVYCAPDPLVRGQVTLKLVVTDAQTAAPIEGLSMTMHPWMPAMGHGASTIPIITDAGGGTYIANDVVLFMPGQWQLRTDLAGARADSFVAVVEVQ